jgi:hypothetical protein
MTDNNRKMPRIIPWIGLHFSANFEYFFSLFTKMDQMENGDCLMNGCSNSNDSVPSISNSNGQKIIVKFAAFQSIPK